MKTEPIQNSFETVLRNQRRGGMLTDLSAAVQSAVQSVREHLQPAKVVLTLTVTPYGGEEGAMSVTDDVTTKLPKPRKSNSLFYATDDGCLVRENPNQTEMAFAIQPKPATTESNAHQSATA